MSSPTSVARARSTRHLATSLPLRALVVGALLMPMLACNDDEHLTEPSPIEQRSNQVVLDWNLAVIDVVNTHDQYANGLDAVRLSAMVHIAQHDALNAIVPVFDRYAFEGSDPAADPTAAAASAAHGVLRTLFPAQQAYLDARLAGSLAAVGDGTAKDRGVALGALAAAAIVEARLEDGSDTPLVGGYEPGTGAGKYQLTPPFNIAFVPGWRHVTPFALQSPMQFRSAAPPALASAAYANAFNEVKSVGRLGSTTRTDDQTAYAKFWYEFSELGWNRIARTVAQDRALGLQSAARLFALLNIAMSDAYVAGWDSKYHYDLWRPITAIHAAGIDGNDATVVDAQWEPSEPTPPVQDYPSTHSALGDAAATVLAEVFGDSTSFSFASPTAVPANSTRSFASFSAAADENADSRVMAGIHFRFAIEAGQAMGRAIGEWAVANHLRER